MENIQGPKYPVLTLEKALDIIDILSRESGHGLGVSEISRKLEMGKSTIHRILDTLSAYGYVEQVPNKTTYRLSWRLYEVGNTIPRQRNLNNFNEALLEDFCNQCHETVNIGIRAKNRLIIVKKKEPFAPSALRAQLSVGEPEPLHATSMGKVLISELDTDSLKQLFQGEGLKGFTPNTITDLETLVSELRKVREQGYAIDNEEYCVGLSCFAMPIRNYDNEIVAATSVSGPSARMNFSKIMQIKEGLSVVAKNLSQFLGAEK